MTMFVFVLGIIYFPPTSDTKECLNLLGDSLDVFSVINMEHLMLVGDFNARIGKLNQMDDDVASDAWFF